VGEAGPDQMEAIEGIIGTAFADTLIGTAAEDIDGEANVLDGRDGDDFLNGLTGSDTLIGGDGDDTLIGDEGADSLSGGDGDDRLLAGLGDDTLRGGSGRDTLTGGGGANLFDGGSGTDHLVLWYLPDNVLANIAFGYVAASNGDVSLMTRIEDLSGGAGNDTLIGGSGANWLTGHTGNDRLEGLGGADRLFGGDGNDTIEGGAGWDTLDGGAGTADLLTAENAMARVRIDLAASFASGVGSGRDSVIGFERVLGSAFNDALIGSTGAETLSGGAGNDNISGLDGDDVLVGGAGNDSLRGAAGRDTFLFDALDQGSFDRIFDFTAGAGGDVLNVSAIDANSMLSGNQAFTLGAVAGAGIVIRSSLNQGGTIFTVYDFHVNNDALADMTIQFNGNHVLTAGLDFLL